MGWAPSPRVAVRRRWVAASPRPHAGPTIRHSTPAPNRRRERARNPRSPSQEMRLSDERVDPAHPAGQAAVPRRARRSRAVRRRAPVLDRRRGGGPRRGRRRRPPRSPIRRMSGAVPTMIAKVAVKQHNPPTATAARRGPSAWMRPRSANAIPTTAVNAMQANVGASAGRHPRATTSAPIAVPVAHPTTSPVRVAWASAARVSQSSGCSSGRSLDARIATRGATASRPSDAVANVAPTAATDTVAISGAAVATATRADSVAVATIVVVVGGVRASRPADLSISSDIDRPAAAARNAFAALGVDGTARNPVAAARQTAATRRLVPPLATAVMAAAHDAAAATTRWLHSCVPAPVHANATEAADGPPTRRPWARRHGCWWAARRRTRPYGTDPTARGPTVARIGTSERSARRREHRSRPTSSSRRWVSRTIGRAASRRPRCRAPASDRPTTRWQAAGHIPDVPVGTAMSTVSHWEPRST